MKKLISALIFIIILTLGINAEAPVSSKSIMSGEYIIFGKYNNAPILWRCVGNDENGKLFLADRILTIKAYDSPHIDDKGQGNKFGSNSWAKSNIRAWLNSDKEAGQVIWGCDYPPKKYNSYDDNNYENEKGFLADGNFTKVERSIIKSVKQKSILNESEIELKDGGSEIHYNKATLDGIDNTESQKTAKSNFDNAYFQWVTDKMFLFDVEQIGREYVVLGAMPTSEAVGQSTYKNTKLNQGETWQYSLRTPIAKGSEISNIRRVIAGKINNNMAADSSCGIRPAFYLDTDYAFIKSGEGTCDSPYVIGPKIVLKAGNSPMAMIDKDDNITDKIKAKTTLIKDYMYNGIHYDPTDWGDAISNTSNPDLDETALFIRKGTYFRDPGFTAYNANGTVLPSTNTKGSITVSVYTGGDTTTTEEKTFNLAQYFSDDYFFSQLRSWNIVPGIYSIEYSTKDSRGKEFIASRPLVVLSTVGDINYDGVTNSIDANYLDFLLKGKDKLELPEGNLAERLYKYRICDVNKDGIINKDDINPIYMKMKEAIVNYYKM